MGLPGNPAHLKAIGQQPGELSRASKYEPSKGFGQKIRDLAQAGEFPEVWAAECGVTKQTLRNWAEAHPEFQEDMLIASALLEAFWSRLPLKHLTNPDLRSTVLMETLRKRFPSTWSDARARDSLEEFEPATRKSSFMAMAERVERMSEEELEQELEQLRRRDQILQEVRLQASGSQL